MTARAWPRRPALLVALGLAALAAQMPSACSRDMAVATALDAAGTVERGNAGVWRDVVPGTPFVVGDTLRTGASSRTRLALAGAGVIRVGENARLRFQQGGLAGRAVPAIGVELGSAEVEETVAPLLVLTGVGSARIEPGAHIRVHADGQTSSLEVLVGRAVMLEAGQEVALEAGHGIRIHLGSAEIQRFALTVGAAVVEPTPAVVEPTPAVVEAAHAVAQPPPAADAGTVNPAAPKPEPADRAVVAGDAATRADRAEAEHADITLDAGESATLHDDRPAATVRLRLAGLCPNEAVVELGGHGRHRERLSGVSAVALRLRAGAQAYRVRCAGDDRKAAPRAAGVLSLRRDSGDVPLPRRPAVNVIDADGRRYTVLFQTRIPQLTLAWPSAPPGAAGLELHLDSGGGERVIDAASPTRPLPAGTVREGTYTFWYRTPDGKLSPKTTLSVRFDNAAPTAQFFRTRTAGDADPRGAIPVDGVTVDGAKVSVAGQPLAIDSHGRFRIDAKPLEGDQAVAVRLEHPRTGVHYYVRHRSDAR